MNDLHKLSQEKLLALSKALLLETQVGEKLYLRDQIDELKKDCESVTGIAFTSPDLTRLPHPSTTHFIGRGTELEQLEQAFNNRQQTGIVGLIAGGGFGKSALTYQWIMSLKKAEFGGILRVFAWSFYSQGSHQKTFTSSQEFFTKALPFFGFVGELPNDDIEKARILVKFFASQPALLILDGFEPLQHAPDSLAREIADIGIKEFLLKLELHRHSQSFVLISSRQPIVELQGRADYLEIPLETLSVADGTELLQALNVKGATREIEAASENLRGHALSLVLLANLLVQYHKGDIRYIQELPALDNDKKHGGQAKRILSYYNQLLSEYERRFMHCLGLFDRPMHWKEKLALLKNAEYFKPLQEDWENLQENLEIKGLLLNPNSKRTQWDTHPLIRQFFAQQLEEQHPQAFRQAHKVLFEYFQSVPEKHQPDTLEELEPLYRAVVHGCLAGEYKIALDVLRERIRQNNAYSLHMLGSYSNELSVLYYFLESYDLQVVNNLLEKDQAWLLAEKSFCLMSLGRLADSIAPRKASMNLRIKIQDWSNATISAINYTELLCNLGQLENAHEVSTQAIDYALHTTDKLEQMISYSISATVLYRLGKLQEAQALFAQSEQLQEDSKTEYPHLYSTGGANYCNVLLETAQNVTDLNHILERGEKIAVTDHLLDIALTHLILARTYQKLRQTEKAQTEFDLSIRSIQKAKKFQYIPEFYLARANFYLTQNELENAKADIDTANETIKRCGMKLYAVDAALASAHYHLARNEKTKAKQFCEQAEMLIEETSYHLRDKALKELQQQVN